MGRKRAVEVRGGGETEARGGNRWINVVMVIALEGAGTRRGWRRLKHTRMKIMFTLYV
jgi:hypothetical protein